VAPDVVGVALERRGRELALPGGQPSLGQVRGDGELLWRYVLAGTKAAKLRAELDKRANGNRWAEILGGADARIRSFEAELSRRTEANAEALARHDYEGRGVANAEKWRRIAALILEADAEYTASAQYQMGVAISVTGLDGRDVFSDPSVAEARKLADRLAEVQPPRSVSLVPLTSEEPPRVRSVSGGFIGANVSLNNAAEDQPERVEPV
jgi:hypothetical protein